MQPWNYFTSNYTGHPLGVRDKCFCACKHRKKIHLPFLANLLKQGRIIFKMQFLTSNKEESQKKISWCSLEFPNKRENTARNRKQGFSGKQRGLGLVTALSGHGVQSLVIRKDQLRQAGPLTLRTKTSLCTHPDAGRLTATVSYVFLKAWHLRLSVSSQLQDRPSPSETFAEHFRTMSLARSAEKSWKMKFLPLKSYRNCPVPSAQSHSYNQVLLSSSEHHILEHRKSFNMSCPSPK